MGDAFTRTVTRSAPDVPAMAFPPLPVTDLDGTAAYPKPPVVRDHSERGTFTGTRIDSVTYVCERAGTGTLPALEFPWWNVRTQTLEEITLRCRSARATGWPQRSSWSCSSPRSTRTCLPRRRCPAAYKALFAWLERVHPRARPATIEQDLPAARTDAALPALVEGLEAAVVAGQKRWDGAPLAAALSRAWSRPANEPLAAALPALDPGEPC